MTDEDPPNEKNESPELNDREMKLGAFGPWGERDRGMFTEPDRDHIAGAASYGSPQARSNADRRVRHRTVDGVTDLAYLAQLDERQRDKVFTEFSGGGDLDDLRTAVSAFVEFLYLGLDGDLEWFEKTLKHGIHNAERGRQNDDKTYYQVGSPFLVDVGIEVSRGYDVDEIEERFQAGRGATLTPTEVGVLVRSGRVEPDELAALEDKYRDPLNSEAVEDDEE